METQRQMAELLAAVQSQSSHLAKLDHISSKVDSLEELKPVLKDFTTWKPLMDQAVTVLQAELGDLRSSIDMLVGSSSTRPPSTPTTVDPDPRGLHGPVRGLSIPNAPPRADVGLGPDGHRSASSSRGLTFGDSFPTSTLVNGTIDTPSSVDPIISDSRVPFAASGSNSRLDFPPFDGENPITWRLKSEAYFRACGVHRDLWIDTAVVSFSGAADLWFQWSQAHLRARTWDQFMEAIQEKFGRQEFQLHVRQFSRLRQVGTVLEYAEQFNAAMHRLRAHHASWDPLYFVTQFVEG